MSVLGKDVHTANKDADRRHGVPQSRLRWFSPIGEAQQVLHGSSRLPCDVLVADRRFYRRVKGDNSRLANQKPLQIGCKFCCGGGTCGSRFGGCMTHDAAQFPTARRRQRQRFRVSSRSHSQRWSEHDFCENSTERNDIRAGPNLIGTTGRLLRTHVKRCNPALREWVRTAHRVNAGSRRLPKSI